MITLFVALPDSEIRVVECSSGDIMNQEISSMDRNSWSYGNCCLFGLIYLTLSVKRDSDSQIGGF